MKVNNPNKISSRNKLKKIMDTPNHGVKDIFNQVDKHNKRFNDNLGCYITITFGQSLSPTYVDINMNLKPFELTHES